jgi:hypothetical protein
LAVSVSDRFGDYGLVGLLRIERAPEALVAETFLLSCRVLGKGVEHRMLARLGELARELGLARVDIPFSTSGRNQPALDFLTRTGGGFQHTDKAGPVFRFPADVAAAVSLQAEAGGAPLPPAPAAGQQRPAAETPMAARPVRPARHAWLARIAGDPEQLLRLIEGGVITREIAPAAEHIPAQTDLQRRLCALWQEVLKLPRVGIRDDFFGLGGTSQLAVRLCARIERQLGHKLPLAALFKGPTVEQIAAALEPVPTGGV